MVIDILAPRLYEVLAARFYKVLAARLYNGSSCRLYTCYGFKFIQRFKLEGYLRY